MRWLAWLVLFVCIGLGTCWLYHNNDQVRKIFHEYFQTKEISALESRYSPEEIAQANRELLQPTQSHDLEPATLRFYPYLYLQVSYVLPDHSIGKEKILWGMHDGEIVTNTHPWETSRGFADCLDAEACHEDLQIIYALISNGGSLSKKELAQQLHTRMGMLDSWITKARQKHLIISKGDQLYLHFLDPKLEVSPQTRMGEPFAIKHYQHADKISAKYTKEQIENMVKAAFGPDLEIINSREVYLPIYTFITRNLEGTEQTTLWNSLNGQKFSSR